MKTLELVLAVSLVPSLASAETETVFEHYRLGVSVGAGVMGFVDGTARAYTSDGGLWDVRVGFNTTGNLAVEAAYVGSLQNIDAVGLAPDAKLLGTGVEANLRLNFMTGRVQPYALLGAGWTRYDLSADTNASDVSGYDNIATLPMGIGISYRLTDVVLDLRGTYRATAGTELIQAMESSQLDSWSATLRGGFEF